MIKGFPLKVKSLRNTENTTTNQKLKGWFHHPPPPPPPPFVPRWRYDCVYVQGLHFSKEGQSFVSLRTSEQYGNVSVVLLTYLTVFPRQSCFAITLMTILVI